MKVCKSLCMPRTIEQLKRLWLSISLKDGTVNSVARAEDRYVIDQRGDSDFIPIMTSHPGCFLLRDLALLCGEDTRLKLSKCQPFGIKEQAFPNGVGKSDNVQ